MIDNPHFYRIEKIEEFHDNGQLAYKETRAFILEGYTRLYRDGLRINPETWEQWIRIGETIKYDRDGKLVWKLIYDNKGIVIDSQFKPGYK